MRTEEFKEWLANRGIADADAIIRYCTNGEKVYCSGDIDAQFRQDGLKVMIHRAREFLVEKDGASYIAPVIKARMRDAIKAVELYQEFSEQNTVVE